ncbi:nuclear transport factor 2 family protein [Streptomyces chrestomyceticus]|uniref:nuclear transport factor 2 family protein n=1 Tax=Streptomyces chrestomyceticus TaxID=68185 RepID=UPI0019D00489|nr:hypothetical protein [Streptomyces chrestomyceticus]
MTGADEPGTARREVFALLEHVDTVDEFFGRLADDVRWTLFGKHPLAGSYRGREEFVPATIGKVRPLLDGGLRFRIRGLYGGGAVTVAEMDGVATAKDGVPYDPFYVWVCRFEGETIVEVNAYIDSAAVNDILERLSPE